MSDLKPSDNNNNSNSNDNLHLELSNLSTSLPNPSAISNVTSTPSKTITKSSTSTTTASSSSASPTSSAPSPTSSGNTTISGKKAVFGMISLSLLTTLLLVGFIVITEAAALANLFSAAYKATDIALDILARETILRTTQLIESNFLRSTQSVASATNLTARFPSPYSFSSDPEKRDYYLKKFWLPQLYQKTMLLRDESALNVRFAVDGSVTFSGHSSSGISRYQFCQTAYPTFLDAPSATAVYDKLVNCTLDGVNRETLVQLPIQSPIRNYPFPSTIRTGVLGPIWNITVQQMRYLRKYSPRTRGFILPQLLFYFAPGITGASNSFMFIIRAQTMSFDRVTQQPIAAVAGVFSISQIGPLLRRSLPGAAVGINNTTSNSNNNNHGTETGSRAFFLDSKGNVLSSSHVDVPFRVVYLNTTGGVVWKSCVGFGKMQGCLYNVSDYPPYHLLKLALETSSLSVSGGTNWSRFIDSSSSSNSNSNSSSATSTTTNGKHRVFKREFVDEENNEYVAFKRKLYNDFTGFNFEVILVIPRDFFLYDIINSRKVSIALVVVLSFIGGICCFFVLRISTSSLRKLCDKMKDPFCAKLKKKEKSELIKKHKQEERDKRAKERKERNDENNKNNNNNVDDNNNKENDPNNKENENEKETEKQQEEEKEKEEEENEEEPEKSCWEIIREWQPEEISELENEFAEFQEVIEKLRGFMNFDFASSSKNKKNKNFNIDDNNTNDVNENKSEKKTKTKSDNNNNNQKKKKKNYGDETLFDLGEEEGEQELFPAASQPPLTQVNYSRSVSEKTSSSDRFTGSNSKSGGRSEEDESGGASGSQSKSMEESGSKTTSADGVGDIEEKQQKRKKKKGVSFDSSVELPEAGVPGKIIMTKRKKMNKMHLHDQSSSLNTKIAPHEHVVAFVAALHIPFFSEPEKYFVLNERGKQLLLDISTFAIQKLHFTTLSNGASIIDFHGDQFFVVVQIRKNIVKTKVPTRFTIDLIRIADDFRSKLTSFASDRKNIGAITGALVPLESYRLGASFLDSPSTTIISAAATTNNNNNNPNFNNNVASPRSQQQTPSSLSAKAIAAMKRTKPGKKAESPEDAAAISYAMHHGITLYGALAFGKARFFTWRSTRSNIQDSSSSSFSSMDTSSASSQTLHLFFGDNENKDENINSNNANNNNNNNSNNNKSQNMISRGSSLFGSCVSSAFTIERILRDCELRQEPMDLSHAFGFEASSAQMFEVVVARKFRDNEVPNCIDGSNSSAIAELEISRLLTLEKVVKKKVVDEE